MNGITYVNLSKINDSNLSLKYGDLNLNIGSVGCEVWKKGTTDNKRYFLVCNHVFGNLSKEVEIISVRKTNKNPLIIKRTELKPIGKLSDSSFWGNFSFKYEDDIERDYFIDSRLFVMPNTEESNDFTKKLNIELSPNLGRVKLEPNKPYKVRKRGYATGLTHGIVIKTDGEVKLKNGFKYQNVIVIKGIDKKSKLRTVFADYGDSGALVYNDNNQAIGQIWGIDRRKKYIAYAAHIHPIMAALKVQIAK